MTLASSINSPRIERRDLPAVVGEAVAGAVVIIEVADHPFAARASADAAANRS